jgi:uncharacterized protein (TIGR02147 family)
MNLFNDVNHLIRPSVLNYLNVTNYLKDYFNFRKYSDNTFSFELWSNELNFKSKSTTRMIAHGEISITEKFIYNLSKIENFSLEEKNHFILISGYKNAKNEIVKSCLLDKILSGNDFTKNKIDIADYSYFIESVLLPKIQLYISFSDIEATVPKVSDAFQLSIQDTEKALHDLKDLDLAYSHDNIVWKSKVKNYKIDAKKSEKSRKIFHKNSIDRSLLALEQTIDLSIFKSIFFSINDNDLHELKKDAAAFFNLLKNKYAKDNIIDHRLYEISVHAKPISKKC